MKCSNCGYVNPSDANFCTNCNNTLGVTSSVSSASGGSSDGSSAPSQAQSAAPAYNTASTRPSPYTYQQPYYYSSSPVKPKQPFVITDAYIIIGFTLSVIGIFTYAFILLPAGIGFSVVGFVKRTNARTLGLSVAGIVIGVVACFIRVGMLLNELGIIPDWLSSGIF